jgi:hypothetical protein
MGGIGSGYGLGGIGEYSNHDTINSFLMQNPLAMSGRLETELDPISLSNNLSYIKKKECSDLCQKLRRKHTITIIQRRITKIN